jgi:hypothetical protein
VFAKITTLSSILTTGSTPPAPPIVILMGWLTECKVSRKKRPFLHAGFASKAMLKSGWRGRHGTSHTRVFRKGSFFSQTPDGKNVNFTEESFHRLRRLGSPAAPARSLILASCSCWRHQGAAAPKPHPSGVYPTVLLYCRSAHVSLFVPAVRPCKPDGRVANFSGALATCTHASLRPCAPEW